ncbi:MAG: InlB B-repeat-containing protein, partial [Bacteroidales bacterium]|nr:InlB B-repeat-containing protein [Bacteroidales bacterium]
FTRDGYTFAGWNTAADGNGTRYADKQEITLGQDITLYAQWQVVSGTENGYAYVDLGLPSGAKWATYNVGADSPYEFGDYFAWGETEPKDNYDWSTYKYCNGSNTSLTKYNTISSYGTVDNKTVLELSDDAARANWGGSWRMPTKAEQDELRNNCTWTGSTQNGVKGYKVTSKTNGNSIFLPADGSVYDVGSCSYGYYWSSSLYESLPYVAHLLVFEPASVDWVAQRYFGLMVRAVYGDDSAAQTFTISFNANGGTGTMAAQTFEAGVSQAITANTFTRSGYVFTGWNTNADGSGTAYTDKQSITLSQNITLYAQWESAGGSGGGSSISGTENGHDYVDLGLPSGIKWATCNVGATSPEGYGDYFAWGETSPKDNYSWSTYKYCNGSETTLTKYNTHSNYYGTIDNKTTLDLIDDAARANWGGSWRMPTKAEQDELQDNCIWTWTTQNGVNGYKVTSKTNGNSIFLPAAGNRNGTSVNNVGSVGHCWSGSLCESSPDSAYGLHFNSGLVGWNYNYRYYGRTVRAVCP